MVQFQVEVFYTIGTIITITAEAYSDFLFLNWTENGNVVSTNLDYSFQVYGARNLVANFVPAFCEITLSANPEEGGIVEWGGVYSYGEYTLVRATSNAPEYDFENWTEDGNFVSTHFIYGFTVTRPRHLVANFRPAVYEFSVIANPYESGKVTGGGIYTYGDHVTLAAIANPDFQFLNWTKYTLGIGTIVSEDPDYTFEVIGDGWANTAFTAYFVPETKVTILTNLPGGEVYGGGTYSYGDEVTVEAIPKPGFKFVNWTQGRGTVSTENPYTFTITESVLLIANFEEDETMGIGNVAVENIKIYPNPTIGELRVKS